MAMATDSMNTMMADLMSSYEQGVKNMTPIFSMAAVSLDVSDDGEMEKQQLRETLSLNGNLRKTDFDRMMAAIMEPRNNRAQNIRLLLRNFLKSQQDMMDRLGGYFAQIRGYMETGDIENIKPAAACVKEIMIQQEQARQKLESELAEQEKGQEEIQTGMKALLKKGRELGVRDFKEMLSGIRRQSKSRSEQNRVRREAVTHMLADYRGQRLSSENRRKMQ